MPLRLVRAAALTAVAALPLVGIAMPASAEVRSFSDAAGDTGTDADITRVRVSHSSTRVAVVARLGRLKITDYATFWFDTNADNAGPEYKVVVYPNSDGITLNRIGDFGDAGTATDCDVRASADAFTSDRVRVSVPRSCMNNPSRVRVSLRARYIDDDKKVTDWAPSERAFFGWVDAD